MIRLTRIAAVVLFTAAFAGCEEEKPAIVFTEPEKPLLDTTYIAAVPARQDKAVFIVDVTGVGCNNCPDAAKTAKSMQDKYPGRVNVMAIYPYVTNPPGALTRPHSGYDTLNTPEADNFMSAFGSISGLPTGMVDQVKSGGSFFIPMTTWAGRTDERIIQTTPVNINLKSTWQFAENRARLEVKLAYNAGLDTAKKHQLFIAIVENNIVGKQANKDTAGGYQYWYKFTHVLRRFVTPVGGVRLGSPLVAGRVFEKHYYISPRFNWKPSNLMALVWVVDETDKTVLHSAEVPLQ